jgi:glycosyltransferase involved in cell wall biosynthesis
MKTTRKRGIRRIVLLVSSMEGGGAERVAATLVNAWAMRGYEVFLVTTFLGESRMDYVIRDDVRLIQLRDAMPPGAAVTSTFSIAKLRALRSLVRDISPDIIISFLTNVNVSAIAALRGLGAPLVVCERTVAAGSVELTRALRLARWALYQFADALVVQTAEAAGHFHACMLRPPPTFVVPNPLPAALHQSPLRANVTAHGGLITAMGRLMPSKQFDGLIRAFGKAFAHDPAWTLTIWGEGPLRSSLQQLIQDMGLDGRVRLCGRTDRPWDALAAAQIFVMSSAYEGFPNVMLEAMALSVACLAYDSPSGTRELACDGNAAVLVRLGDEDGLARALSELAADPARRARLGDFAAASVRERFSEAKVIECWEALFASIQARSARKFGLDSRTGHPS